MADWPYNIIVTQQKTLGVQRSHRRTSKSRIRNTPAARALKREWAARRTLEGKCLGCANYRRRNRQLCQQCQDKVPTARAKKYAAGLCVRCTKPNDTRNRTCSACYAKKIEYTRRRADELHAEGRCIRCAQPKLVNAHFRFCWTCRLKGHKYRNRARLAADPATQSTALQVPL